MQLGEEFRQLSCFSRRSRPGTPASTAGPLAKEKPGDGSPGFQAYGTADQPLRTEEGSTFTPGPIVEETAMRWM